jgi:hypothetical protein
MKPVQLIGLWLAHSHKPTVLHVQNAFASIVVSNNIQSVGNAGAFLNVGYALTACRIQDGQSGVLNLHHVTLELPLLPNEIYMIDGTLC